MQPLIRRHSTAVLTACVAVLHMACDPASSSAYFTVPGGVAGQGVGAVGGNGVTGGGGDATGGTDPAGGSGPTGGNGPTGGTNVTAQSDLVIDHMDDCDGDIDPAGSRDGYWFVFNATCDEMSGSQTPPASCSVDPEPLQTMSQAGSGCEAATSGGGFPNSRQEGWGYAGIAIRFRADGSSYDACRFGGFKVTVSGTPIRVNVVAPITSDDFDHFGAYLTSGTRSLTWNQLSQDGWGSPQRFDCSEIIGLEFQAEQPGDFDFAVDDIEFITGSSGSGGTGGTGGGGTGGGTNLIWRTANLTVYTSYPDPGSDECLYFSGCDYVGQFSALEGVQPESWVQANNIAAVHSRDFGQYELKTLRVRQGSREIDVTIYDLCSDNDCGGCCTRNSSETGFLIDMESYTAERFGSQRGIVEWACLDC